MHFASLGTIFLPTLEYLAILQTFCKIRLLLVKTSWSWLWIKSYRLVSPFLHKTFELMHTNAHLVSFDRVKCSVFGGKKSEGVGFNPQNVVVSVMSPSHTKDSVCLWDAKAKGWGWVGYHLESESSGLTLWHYCLSWKWVEYFLGSVVWIRNKSTHFGAQHFRVGVESDE